MSSTTAFKSITTELSLLIIIEENQFKSELKCKSFQGVFACNELKAPMSLPASYIVNTDPRSKPGKHWTAIYIDHHGNGEYFDSFGKKPTGLIYKFMQRTCKTIKFNKKCLQNNNSISCGVYCIYYLKHRNRFCTMSKSLRNMSSDTLLNEVRLIRFFLLNS